MARPVFEATASRTGNLAELCPVVEGAIVSKPLLEVGECRQVLFALDEGQRISRHQAPFAATVHVLEGRLRFDVGAETHAMGPNDWLVMPPGEPHALLAEQPTRFLLTLVGEGPPAA